MQAWIAPLREIFRELQTSKRPTTHMVIVAYYKVERYCSEVSTEIPPCLHLLAGHLWSAMERKYWKSTTTLHMVAAFLHPNLKSLSMLSNSVSSTVAWVNTTRQDIRQGIVKLAANINIPTEDQRNICIDDDASTSTAVSPPKKKGFFDDMFEVGQPVVEPSRHKTIFDELDSYEAMVVSTRYPNPLVFWLHHADQFQRLNCVARRVFITQASSAESERHFSCAGNIITEKRGSLASDTVEMLVLLKLNSWLF